MHLIYISAGSVIVPAILSSQVDIAKMSSVPYDSLTYDPHAWLLTRSVIELRSVPQHSEAVDRRLPTAPHTQRMLR